MTHPAPDLPARLRAELEESFSAFGRELGDPELEAAWAALLRRRGWGRADLFDPAGQPVLELVGWTAGIAASRGRAVALDRLVLVGLSAAFGYLHVSVQDALIDAGEGEPGAAALLSDLLFARHQRLLLGVVGEDPGFWDLFEATWRSYAGAMLLERRLLRRDADCDREAFDRILQRSMPLLLPPAAVLHAAGMPERVEPLRPVVFGLAAVAQLVDDLRDLHEDLERGAFTWLLRRLGGLDGPSAVTRTLVLDCGLDEVVDTMLNELDAVEAAARASGVDAATLVAPRRAAIRAMQDEVWQAVFGRFARHGDGGSPGGGPGGPTSGESIDG